MLRACRCLNTPRTLAMAFVLWCSITWQTHADDHPGIGRYVYETGTDHIVRGTVVDQRGQPVPGAQVFAYGDQWSSSPHPKLPTLELGTCTSDAQGSFALAFKPLSLASHKLCVLAPGHGLSFGILEVEQNQTNPLRVTLPAERIIEGLVKGPDGQPAAGVDIEVWSVVDQLHFTFGQVQAGNKPRPIVVKSRKDGTFTVRGLSRSLQEVWFRIDDERYALMECNRFGGETARSMDGVVRLDAKRDSPITLQLQAARFVTGTVRRQDTKQPLAGAWVGVVMAQWKTAGDSYSMALWKQADERGQFRVRCGAWGPHLCVYAYAPQGVPCPDWSIGPVVWSDHATEHQIDIEMPQGTMVKGRVVEKETGTPIAGASLIYMVRREKPRVLDRTAAARIYWANEYHRRYSAEDGTFEQPVASGEIGFLMVKAPNGNYTTQFTTLGNMQFDTPGGTWCAVEALVRVEPAEQAKLLQVDIPLTRGQTIAGTVTGPQGEPVERGFAIRAKPTHTQDNQSQGIVLWGESILHSKFTLPGCDPNKPCEVYLLDTKHHWGETIQINPQKESEQHRQVKLKPCGSARIKLLDDQKRPITGNLMTSLPRLELVIAFRDAPLDTNYSGDNSHLQVPVSQFDYQQMATLAPDAQGYVKLTNLIPGAPYKLMIHDGKPLRAGERRPEKNFRVTSGVEFDLGEWIIKKAK